MKFTDFTERKSMESGILLLDKPAGLTSHDVTHAVAGKLNIRAGHTGTLDKFATGLLIVCIEKATRASEYLTSLSKEYTALAVLGKITDTYDREGKTLATSDLIPSRKEVEELSARMSGTLEQIPPPYSAKKIRGRRASDYARKGINVHIRPSKVHIHEIAVARYDYPEMELHVSCSSGTYVRSLVKDIGDILKCGAYTSELRRTKIGNFSVADSTFFQHLMEESPAELERKLIPLADALYFMPAIKLNKKETRLFQNGRKVEHTTAGEKFRVFEDEGPFLGVGRGEKGFLVPEKLLKKT